MRIATLDTGGTIAALLFRRVGDSVLATPALRAIKSRYPELRTIVICEPQVKRVFEGLNYVDEIIDIGSSPSSLTLAKTLRAIPILSATVDFLSDPRSALACAMGGAAVRVGFAKSFRRIMYTHRAAVQEIGRPVFSAIHKLSLAQELGAHSNDCMPDFSITSNDQKVAEKLARERKLCASRTVALFVTSRREYKRWPIERFVEIVRLVKAEGDCSIAVIGGENERAAVEDFCNEANLTPESAFIFISIGEMAAFLSRCTLYFGNDGGPKHLAVAVGTPTVTVFQNDPWEYWTPPDSTRHMALGGKGQSPSVDEVAQAVQAMLNH